MTEFTRFFQREWKCINRGRWGQSKIAAFSSGPVLVIGSVILLSSFLERRGRRKSEGQRAAEKEGEDWGDGFQYRFQPNSKLEIHVSFLHLQYPTASNKIL
ncbi:uncharacterized protein K444DRAFT_442049 [Hyaloscypha bicolor E]|uniref:Uncharacterized protein n=1 Tax=Hyaloscypha bicolor E TaxID=1095630 RepID=A0A2J6T5J0_9HELO|nr:uncharacterized protein K444DRAFT_442049 [Hyaloscypha bicolor E]PMD58278.1 hypothetical protein K444DRAFT_442049 [Hyaloscypha bicolor E]